MGWVANCEMRKREIYLSVKCETKCEFCVAFFLFLGLLCLTATTDEQPLTDLINHCHWETSEFV